MVISTTTRERLPCPTTQGTYTSRLCNFLGVLYITTDDLVRHELASKGPLSSRFPKPSFYPSSSTSNVFVYDSKVLTWRRFENHFGVNLADTNHQQQEPFSVVKFDLGNGKLERPIGVLLDQVTFLRLVSDGGEGKKLFLIGRDGSNGISRSIKLWEFCEENWNKVDSLPDLMCKKFVCAGWLFVSTGLAYDVFGSHRPNEYFTENRQGIPLITGRLDPLDQLDEFSRSF
ncbi:hypothetical protein PIB30_006100 [Stylosanthes scabra]|uniref:Photosystem II cytochrome b559 alpha subunit lumenal region domain-containing protein n=1 Tax=Stylosanthes scabra TaxID=79078 RepID=A0ABU6W4V7_9FABA|nr:hypothetical protein [Stylosanthes scabra]